MKWEWGPILSLDLATRLGFCEGIPGGVPRYGSFTLPSTGEDIGPFLKAYHEWLIGMLAFGPKLVTYETPILGGNKMNFNTVEKLVGLSNHTQFVCCMKGIEYGSIRVQENKKFFAGHGHAQKPDMMAAARRYGLDPKTTDEADAIGLWAYTVNLRARQYDDRFSLGLAGARPLEAA